MSFNSKYSGQQVENLLDQVANGNTGGGSSGGITVELDPIFSASPAAKITDENISSWNNKVDKVSGKQLSTEDFTTALKDKLSGLNNYDDTEITQAVSKLRTDFDTLVSGDTTTAIKTFNEVIAFLDGLEDTEDLASIIASIEQQIAGKMDKVTLAAVATSGSYNDLKDKPTIPSAVTESTVSGWGFTKNTGTYSKPSTGIPKTDLASAVQTSLGKADTALQSHQDISGKQDKLVSGTNIKTINGTSILGSGNIVIEGGNGGSSSGGNYPQERIEVVNGECYVNPNTYNLITISEDTVIHFNLPTNEDIYNEYFFEIFVSANFSVTFDTPDGIRWAIGLEEPTFEMNDEIQISVDSGGFGLWAKF